MIFVFWLSKCPRQGGNGTPTVNKTAKTNNNRQSKTTKPTKAKQPKEATRSQLPDKTGNNTATRPIPKPKQNKIEARQHPSPSQTDSAFSSIPAVPAAKFTQDRGQSWSLAEQFR